MLSMHLEGGVREAELARIFGLSRQRVDQILKKQGVTTSRIVRDKVILVTCHQCGETFNASTHKRKYCSRECFLSSKRKYVTEEEKLLRDERKKERSRIRANLYYHWVVKRRQTK